MEKIIVAGQSNLPLAKSIATNIGSKLANVEIEYFANNEKRIRITSSLAGKEAVLVQSTIAKPDEYIVELALLADAARSAGASKVTAVMPWFGYSPQDKIFRQGEALSSSVVIKILEGAGIEEFHVFDLHSPLVQKMFATNITNHSAMPLFRNYFQNEIQDKENWVAVSVDKGSSERAEEFARAANLPIVRFDKTRDLQTGEVTFQRLNGDVDGKKVIAFDDYVSTGGTLFKSAEYMKERGALEYHFCVTHIVVESTLGKVAESSVDRLITTNSIHILESLRSEKIWVLDLAPLILI
jgi:ribose-phosphate pyrophosphokinase